MRLGRRRFVIACGTTWGLAVASCREPDAQPSAGGEDDDDDTMRVATPRFSVHARVTSGGAPIEGAVVLLSPEDPAVVARARPGRTVRPIHAVTDRVGAAVLSRVAAGRYALTAAASGWFPARTDVTIDASTGELALSLVAGGIDAIGTVLDVHGAPVVGALVVAWGADLAQVRTFGHAAVTDADGRYRISTDGQAIALRVAHPGMTQVWTSRRHPGRPLETCDVRMERAATVTGVVRTPDGAPVPGALVLVRDDRGAPTWFGGPEALVATDVDGRFSIDHARAGAVELTAIAPRWATPVPTIVEVGVGRRHADAELVALPAHVVHGTILRGTEPRSGHYVAVAHALHGTSVERLAPSDSAGRFAIDGVLPGDAVVKAAWPTVWPSELAHELRVDEHGVDPVELVQAPRPSGSVTVRVESATAGDVVLGRDPDEPRRPTAPLLPRPIDPHGYATLTDVPAGRHTVWARTPDGAHARMRVSVEPGADTPITVVPDPHTTLRGVVRDHHGAPLPGATVVIERPIEPSGWPEAWDGPRVGTDADGRFVVRGLRQQMVELHVELGGRMLPWVEPSLGTRWDRERIQVHSHRSSIDRVLSVQTPGARLKGRVVGPDGTPRADVRVVLRHEPVERTEHRAFDGQWSAKLRFPEEPMVATDEDGRFEIAGLLDGEHELRAVDPLDGALALERVIAPARDVEVRLVPPARLTGRVTHGGEPVSRFALDVGEAMGSAGVGAGVDGRIEVIRVPPGPHEVSVAAPEGHLLFDVQLAAGRSLSVDVELRPWAQIEGRVVDASGTPLAGLEVRLERGEGAGTGPHADTQTHTVFTAADGRFRLERVFPGTRRVRLRDGTTSFTCETIAGRTFALGKIVVK
jgi:hypothetical protein